MKWWNRQKLLLSYNFPFYTYLQVWRYFKRPKMNFVFNKMESHLMEIGIPARRQKNWFTKNVFRHFCCNTIYKDKEYYTAYENPPQINLVFFDKYQFLFRWIAPDNYNDVVYWETIQMFIDWHKSNMLRCVEENTWTRFETKDDESEERIPVNVVTLNFLTSKGIKMYEKEINLRKN